VVLHILAGQLYFIFVGVLIAGGTRTLILGSGGARWAREHFPFGIIPFLIGYSLFLFLPNILGDRVPRWVESLGASAGGHLHLMQLPVAVWSATVEGSWARVTGWFLLLMALAAWAGRAVWRWRWRARADLILDADSGPRSMSPLRFGSSTTRPRWFREVRLFWIKDLVAPALRQPLREVRTHGILLTLAITSIGVLTHRAGRGLMDAPTAEVLLSALVLAIAGLLTMRFTLGRIGTEGQSLLLLRPILTPITLFSIKCATGALGSVLQSSAYMILVSGAALTLGMRRDLILYLVLEGTGWGLLLAPFGTALGFLFPDFRRNGLFLRGASHVSMFIFSTGILLPGALYLTGRWLHATGLLGPRALISAGFLAAAVVLGLSLALIPIALHSHARREP
jgi:hypothetical protein